MIRLTKTNLILVFLIGATGCESGSESLTPSVWTQEVLANLDRLSPLGVLPSDPTNAVADHPGAAALGQFLFFDTRLSQNGEVACATCHTPEHGFADELPLSKAVGTTKRHTPTVLNTAYNRWFFWDGRADSQWAQALKPLEDPGEHGFSRLEFVHLISADPQLRQAYEGIFGPLPDFSDTTRFPSKGGPIGKDLNYPPLAAWVGMAPADQTLVNEVFSNLGKTIAAYERKLVTGPSAFDVFVEGLETNDPDKVATLSESAQRGALLFVGKALCTRCHSGPELTDREFHNVGLGPRDWMADPKDGGRAGGAGQVIADVFNGKGNYSDAPADPTNDKLTYLTLAGAEQIGQFKTPSLRNVALTPPYMHSGHFETLAEVVRFYSELDENPLVGHREEVLEPLHLTDDEIADLVAFLESLTGELPDSALLTKPDSPLPPNP
ncbi:MAG: c-type cytochrome [Myxococcales bacterium]|nr:c-type cytochrome [Myxococcales bacterium]